MASINEFTENADGRTEEDGFLHGCGYCVDRRER